MNKSLLIDNWLKLDDKEKIEILYSFEKTYNKRFILKTFENFGHNGFSTGIFDFEGSEFLFIPGWRGLLGWKESVAEDKFIMEAVQKELEIACDSSECNSIDYLRELFSSLRECEISPMLVERKVIEWEFQDNNLPNYHKIIADIKGQNFSVLTEDEWEYLCGCGTRRIFGEHINDDYLKDICQDKFYYYYKPRELEKPNLFGLYISYNPYMYELVNSPCYAKGGDGGGAAHGGYYTLGILPLSPYYREPGIQEYTISGEGNFEFSVFARRIIRI